MTTCSRAYVMLSLAFVALTAACGSEQTQVQACEYDFAVNVRTGTDAGLWYAGNLALQVDAKGNLNGLLQPAGQSDPSKYLKVSGTAQDTAVTMSIALPDGRQISGTGTLPSALATCASSNGKVTGNAMGPATDDRGDWDASYIAKFACAATCEFFGLSSHCDSYCANGRTG